MMMMMPLPRRVLWCGEVCIIKPVAQIGPDIVCYTCNLIGMMMMLVVMMMVLVMILVIMMFMVIGSRLVVIRMIMNKADDDADYIMPDMVRYTPCSPSCALSFYLLLITN